MSGISSQAAPTYRAFPLVFPAWKMTVGQADPARHQARCVMFDGFLEVRGSYGKHYATDIIVPQGTIIVAAMHGVVGITGWNPAGGWATIIHSVGVKTGADYNHYYAHMMGPPFVKPGDTVEAGDVLGLVGNTGGATEIGSTNSMWDRGAGPPHLHFALYDKQWLNMNPYPELSTFRGFYKPRTDVMETGAEFVFSYATVLEDAQNLTIEADALAGLRWTPEERRRARLPIAEKGEIVYSSKRLGFNLGE